jgi:copper(I)-binding protein
MKKLIALALIALAACGAPPAPEQTEAPSATVALPQGLETEGLEIRDAWASPTPGGVDVSAGYLTIANGGPADRLVSVSSPRAARVMIHEMSMDGNMMRMREVSGGLDVPAGSAVSFGPGGLHLMFTGVTQPFAVGEEIPVTLTFENAGVREIMLSVRTNAAGH